MLSNATPEVLARPPPEPSPPTKEALLLRSVQVLPGVLHPDVINDQPRAIADSFVLPDEALDLVPGPLRHDARENRETSLPEEMLR